MKFKSIFGVTGSPAQIAAFKEIAEGLGWKYQANAPENVGSEFLYFNAETDNTGPGIMLQIGCFWHDRSAPFFSTTYHLPAQLPQAIAAATPEEIAAVGAVKVGGWRTVVEIGGPHPFNKVGYVFQVSDVTDCQLHVDGYVHCCHISRTRPATDAEILAAGKSEWTLPPMSDLIPFDLDKAKSGNVVRKDGKVAVDWHLFEETNEYPAMLVVLFDNEPPSGYNEYGNNTTNLPLFMLPDVKVVYANVGLNGMGNMYDKLEQCTEYHGPALCVLAFTTTEGKTSVQIVHTY